MLDNKTKLVLNKLFLELMEGSISDSRLLMLDEYLRQSPEVQAYYCQFMHAQVSMNKVFASMTSADSFAVFSETDTGNDAFDDLTDATSSGSKVADSSNFSLRGVDIEQFMPVVDRDDAEDNDKTHALLEILELERTSPAVIQKPKPVKPKRELIQKVVHLPREKRKLTKFQKFQLAFAACIIGFMIYISYAPVHVPPPVVAELADSIDAVWDDDLELPDEYGYMVQSRYRLRKGYASILFTGGAKITIEAPAELSLMSGGNMELSHGKIYATVPQRAHGFTVTAGNSKIVDLGTEFGIEVDTSNNTQLHVTKGRTMLFAGLMDESTEQVEVKAGSAKKIYNDGFVTDIPVAKEKFVRRMHNDYELAVKRNRPMAYWRFDQSQAGKIINSVNRKTFFGEVSGTVDYVDGPDIGDGVANTAIKLDGNNSVGLVGIPGRYSNVDAYTIIMWVRFDEISKQVVMANINDSLYRCLGITEDGKVHHYLDFAGEYKCPAISKRALLPNTWYQIAVTAESLGNKRVYINGVEEGMNPPDDKMGPISKLYPKLVLGGTRIPSELEQNEDLLAFKGAVDEVALFDHALSAKQIFDLYKSREPLKNHFGGQANLFDSNRRQKKQALASAKPDFSSLPEVENLQLAAQKQLLELPLTSNN